MRHSFLLLAGCYGLASGLWAGSIYNYTATSASVQALGSGPSDTTAIVYTNTTLVSGPGFSLNVGGSGGESLNRYFAGQPIPPTQLLFIEGGGATVNFGGIIEPVSIPDDLRESGSVQVTLSEGPFIIPPNPNESYPGSPNGPSYTLPARLTGQFTAYTYDIPGCGTDSKPPCDASAVLSIDLPGTLSLYFTHVSPDPRAYYVLQETFASVPEPSSLGLWLLGTGIGGTAWLARRRKVRA